jgi:prepilin-type N-terminal cleavage/methylation domain-containing protein
MKHRGFTLLEIFIAVIVLGTLATLSLKFFAAVNGQRKDQWSQLAATQEAANVMERLSAVAWEELPKQSGEKFPLSPQARKVLPEPRVEVHVSGTLRVPLADGTRSVPDTLARRIQVTVRWRPQPGEPERKAHLVTWRYKQP